MNGWATSKSFLTELLSLRQFVSGQVDRTASFSGIIETLLFFSSTALSDYCETSSLPRPREHEEESGTVEWKSQLKSAFTASISLSPLPFLSPLIPGDMHVAKHN